MEGAQRKIIKCVGAQESADLHAEQYGHESYRVGGPTAHWARVMQERQQITVKCVTCNFTVRGWGTIEYSNSDHLEKSKREEVWWQMRVLHPVLSARWEEREGA